jgi:hypothetical protein
MKYLFAVVCFIISLSIIIWYKSPYKAYAKFMAKRFSEFFGDFASDMKWDDPENKGLLLNYKWGIIGAGLFFLGLALYLLFGTIHIESRF